MKTFAVICSDGGDKSALRAHHVQAHLDHVETNMGRYRVAGPMKNAHGETTGSLLIITAADEVAAEAFIGSDPYARAGIWDTVMISEFVGAAGEWVGGAAWKH